MSRPPSRSSAARGPPLAVGRPAPPPLCSGLAVPVLSQERPRPRALRVLPVAAGGPSAVSGAVSAACPSARVLPGPRLVLASQPGEGSVREVVGFVCREEMPAPLCCLTSGVGNQPPVRLQRLELMCLVLTTESLCFGHSGYGQDWASADVLLWFTQVFCG